MKEVRGWRTLRLRYPNGNHRQKHEMLRSMELVYGYHRKSGWVENAQAGEPETHQLHQQTPGEGGIFVSPQSLFRQTFPSVGEQRQRCPGQ